MDATPDDISIAKSYLMEASSVSNMNLYDHLSNILLKILSERPKNAVDVLEDVSFLLKKRNMKDFQTTFRYVQEITSAIKLAELQLPLVEVPITPLDYDRFEMPVSNMMENMFYFEQAGISLPKEECYMIYLSLKKLADSLPLQRVRFWGKIFGTEKDYIIAEVEFQEGEDELAEDEEPQALEQKDEEEKQELEEQEENASGIKLPESKFKPPPEIPAESYGTGTNKQIFFVTNQAGLSWVRLPPVTPQQIVTARKIRKLFTGNLDSQVATYPAFPGNESNYLRAQLARISAGTQVSPIGFYKFPEEEVEDDDEVNETIAEDPDFEPLSVQELVDSAVHNWVHHVQNILTQGRCKWYQFPKHTEDDEQDEEDEEDELGVDIVSEAGPPLLTPLSDDVSVERIVPWSVRASSLLNPAHALALVRSNLWPGAYTYCTGRKFENIYIGDGLKFSALPFSPILPPAPQTECTHTEVEVDDPSPEEEAELQKQLEEQKEDTEEEAEAEDTQDEDED